MANKLERIDAPGIRAEGAVLHNMRREVANLLHRQQLGFPGAQPVSFSRRHMDELRKQDYYVCEKTDGIRYLLYLTEDEGANEVQYLIDRKNDYWFLPPGSLHLPRPDDAAGFHVKTLVDGELVVDDLGHGNTQPNFLVFDCLILDNKDLTERTLDKRLGYFKEAVFKPYQALFRKYPEERQFQAFGIEMKNMQYSYGIEMMFRTVLPNLKHSNDGLIFTRCNTAYHSGTDPHILKWKPVAENTIDFRIELTFPPRATAIKSDVDDGDDDSGTINSGSSSSAHDLSFPDLDYDALPTANLLAYHGDSDPEPYQLFKSMYLTADEWDAIRSTGDPVSNRVVECALDDQQRWRIHRFRDDKPEANHISTVKSVLESIRDSVSEEELMDAAKSFKEGWRARQQTQHEQPRR
ncbi:mRNA capping enzyme alpha [Grosmannia clavigera kw1407]|uniref:mRNA-capping enzyme subunit alpha n=1 Tax=Grosmannia clavigera (strain kw1407 / UAMH 11150) TaxID=655863 RepID=F0XPX8_GROCL|nr:mRNA capping enzyme alpha [Grosmannia clavigera kw1407]EFX00610.1 mRNA capping enzyme alpha [Grosmannia clavigera kw1407]